jgi:hypothetical protein
MALEQGLKDGSTATVAVLRNRSLTIANIGDSRAILVRRADPAAAAPDAAAAADSAAAADTPPHEAVPLTVDHRPDHAAERARIEATDGRVVHARGAWRVQGDLAVSRAIGNAPLRPHIVATPDHRTVLVPLPTHPPSSSTPPIPNRSRPFLSAHRVRGGGRRAERRCSSSANPAAARQRPTARNRTRTRRTPRPPHPPSPACLS